MRNAVHAACNQHTRESGRQVASLVRGEALRILTQRACHQVLEGGAPSLRRVATFSTLNNDVTHSKYAKPPIEER